MADFNPNQQNFIHYELAVWARGIEERLRQVMKDRGIEVTGELIRSLSYKIYSAGSMDSGAATLSFKQYGRFVDMGAGRIQKIESIETNGLLLQRKPKKWYAQTVFRNVYGYLVERLITGYQEQVVYAAKIETQ